MIKKQLKIIITFFTSTEAMQMSVECEKQKINGSLISTPRKLSADCGIAYACDIIYKNDLKKIIENKKIEYDKFVELEV